MSFKFIFSFFIGIFLTSIFFSFKPGESGTKGATSIKRMTMQEALNASKSKPKKIIVDIYTDWCGWCKKMDKDTYENTEIINYINTNYYPVKFNAERPGDINFKNKVFKLPDAGGRTTHEFTQVLMRQGSGYPTTCFMDEEQTVLQSIPGYIDSKMMNMIVKYFGGNHYKNTEWNMYQSNFK